MTHAHFEGKDALEHVKAKRVLAETHGTEMPGYLSAACDAAKEMAVVLLLFWTLYPRFVAIVIFAAAFLVWKVGRSGWLGWARLERLHRLVEEERWEIEHHRPQERDELVALYGEKGLEGELLEEVVDVLMADSDRLLRVMLEEEMGLTLEAYEHPLKQAIGAGVGAVLAAVMVGVGTLFLYGPLILAMVTLGVAGWIAAKWEKNRLLPSVIWNLAVGAVSYGLAALLS